MLLWSHKIYETPFPSSQIEFGLFVTALGVDMILMFFCDIGAKFQGW